MKDGEAMPAPAAGRPGTKDGAGTSAPSRADRDLKHPDGPRAGPLAGLKVVDLIPSL